MLFLVFVLSEDDGTLVQTIYEAENVNMYSVALKILSNTDDAEEAVQKAFLRIANKIERIKKLPKSAFLCYMEFGAVGPK